MRERTKETDDQSIMLEKSSVAFTLFCLLFVCVCAVTVRMNTHVATCKNMFWSLILGNTRCTLSLPLELFHFHSLSFLQTNHTHLTQVALLISCSHYPITFPSSFFFSPPFFLLLLLSYYFYHHFVSQLLLSSLLPSLLLSLFFHHLCVKKLN